MNTIPFTSIANLRRSSAMQNRVTQVEDHLKSLNPSWQSEWFFPIPAIALSNALDDVSWVQDATDVHSEITDNFVVNDVMLLGAVFHDLPTSRVTSKAEAHRRLTAVNEKISQLIGRDYSWTQGMSTYDGLVFNSEAARTYGGEAQQVDKSSDEALSDTAFKLIKDMSKEDIMLLFIRVSEGNGGLLSELSHEEQTNFLKSMGAKVPEPEAEQQG